MSTFVTRMLRHASVMIDPPPEKITWCYGQWQSAYSELNLPDVQFEEVLPSSSLFHPKTRNLVIIDDPMAESDERVTTLFTKKVITGTHPYSISYRTSSVTSTGDLTYNRLWLVPALFVLLPHVHPQHRDGHPSLVGNDDKWTSRKVPTRPHVVRLRRWTIGNPVKGHAIRDDELVSDKEEKVTRSTTSTVNACSFYLRHINQISCFF